MIPARSARAKHGGAEGRGLRPWHEEELRWQSLEKGEAWRPKPNRWAC